MKRIVRKSVVISCALLQSACVIASETQLVEAAAAAAPRLSGERRIDSFSLDQIQQLQQVQQQQQRPPIANAPEFKEITLSFDLKAKLVKFVVLAMQSNGLAITESGATAAPDGVKRGCFTRNKKNIEESSIKKLEDAIRGVNFIFRTSFAGQENEALKQNLQASFADQENEALKQALQAFDGIQFHDKTTAEITGFLRSKVTSKQVLTPIISLQQRTRFVTPIEQSPERGTQGIEYDVKKAVIQAIEGAARNAKIDPKVDLQESLKKQTAHVATQAVAAGLTKLAGILGLSVPAGLLVELTPVVVSELIAGSQFVITQVGKSSCCRKLKQKPAVASLVASQQAGDNSLVSQSTVALQQAGDNSLVSQSTVALQQAGDNSLFSQSITDSQA